jgi:diphthine synthase
MLYLVGIGLADAKDITVKGLEAIKECDLIYIENYTSKLVNSSIQDLEKLYGKKIIPADRSLVENSAELIQKSKTKNIALLVIGDPFGATTHINLILEAKKLNIDVKIIHNTSILNAIGEIGLELYKFGHITSIPFSSKDIKSPVKIFNNNYRNGLHTLFLLDLDPVNKKFMKVREAVDYLLTNKVKPNILAVGCSAIGSENPEIKVDKLAKLKNYTFSKYPHCLVIPAKKLHFIEEEVLSAGAS